MTPSSTLPFVKSTAAETTSVVEYIKYGFENWDGTQSPCIDLEHFALTVSLRSSILQKGSLLHAIEFRVGEPTYKLLN
jgi:hypothetical protein